MNSKLPKSEKAFEHLNQTSQLTDLIKINQGTSHINK